MNDLAKLYLAEAKEMLSSAINIFQIEEYNTSVNRCYYAVFNTAMALLLQIGIQRTKHSAVLSAFRKEFIKTGFIDKSHSDFYGLIMDSRNAGDYDPHVGFGKEEVSKFIEKTEMFISESETWLIENFKS